MIRVIGDNVVAFDCEWIPDAQSARLMFPEVGATATDEQALQALWAANGATDDNPRPFVRLMQSRVVSIAMVVREFYAHLPDEEQVKLKLAWLPVNPDDPASRDERKIVKSFLASVGKKHPQLIGFNSRNSDLRILAQRALTLGIQAPAFLHRPTKPWEGIDYFNNNGDGSIDLMELITGAYGRNAACNLHEACTLCGIPGKFGTHGDEVFEMWQQGRYREIAEYNCYDAISTYLLWLRLAWVSGQFTDNEYVHEQELLRDLLMDLADKPETAFIEAYINEWDRLLDIKGE